MRNIDRKIRLTEQDLHFVVENAVRKIIRENMEDEGLGQFFNNVRSFGNAWYGNRKIQGAIKKIKQDLKNLNYLANQYKMTSLGNAIETFETQLDNLGTEANDNKDYYKSNMWDMRTQQQKDRYNQLLTKRQNTDYGQGQWNDGQGQGGVGQGYWNQDDTNSAQGYWDQNNTNVKNNPNVGQGYDQNGRGPGRVIKTPNTPQGTPQPQPQGTPEEQNVDLLNIAKQNPQKKNDQIGGYPRGEGSRKTEYNHYANMSEIPDDGYPNRIYFNPSDLGN